MRAIALNCTLKRGDAPSSTDRMIGLLGKHLTAAGVEAMETIRVANHDVLPGVSSDEGDGDAWPAIRKQVLAADILVLGTPIWMGQPGSVSKRVLERMDAFLSETDDRGRTPAFGKVALVAVVGNEDGAHHVCAELYQALADVGWTLPPQGGCYWVGEAMQHRDFKDLEAVPDKVDLTARMAAANAVHLARLLGQSRFPGIGKDAD
ncbi:flavodoxin family protein [Lysobacter xanthus]